MSEHSYYERLCSPAAIHQLSSAEAEKLEAHLDQCPECKLRAADFLQLQTVVLPAFDRPTERMVAASRNRVETAVWAKISSDSLASTPDTSPAPWWRALQPRGYFRTLAAGAALSAVALGAFFVGVHVQASRSRLAQNSIAASGTERSLENLPPADSRVEPIKKQTSPTDNGEWSSKLNEEQAREKALEEQLSNRDQLLAAASLRGKALQDQLEAQLARQSQQMDQQNQTLASIRAELDSKERTLQQAIAGKTASETDLVALRYQVDDLSKKLASQSTSLDREKEMLSHGREIRDIIGARNLHIIDIYDTDPEGATQKPFGRAFYTEGKSLIFYAYDLPARKTEDGKYVYAAWGQKNGRKDKVLNLGILLNDDKNQKRWEFNFSDPSVLAEIDSVFITLEPAGFDSGHPKGKRMLTAFLSGQVNHP